MTNNPFVKATSRLLSKKDKLAFKAAQEAMLDKIISKFNRYRVGEKPGIGTIMNILIIATVLDLSTNIFNLTSNLFLINFFTALSGVIIVGIGSGIYLIANLGPGPRDGLMTGLQKASGYPIAWVRSSIEITVVLLGWILGGTIGVGTLLFTFGVGPAVAFGLNIISALSKEGAISSD